MPNIIKILEKGRHVVIPDGWEQVHTGIGKKYDMFYNLQYKRFAPLDDEDIADCMPAEDYACLIRKKDSGND